VSTSTRTLIERACARIAPTWPLDRFIAVNPFWGWIDRPMPEVAVTLGALSGARLLPPRAAYRAALQGGALREAHVRYAIAKRGAPTSIAELTALLEHEVPSAPDAQKRARVLDVWDAPNGHEMPLRDFVTTSVSQFCASYFDEGQATFPRGDARGLYASWLRFARIDQGPAVLLALAGYDDAIRAAPNDAVDMIERALSDLGVPDDAREAYLTGLLLDLNGWAAWCMYRRWTARLAERDDDAIVDLLAIQIAWEWVLHRAGGRPVALRFQHAMRSFAAVDTASAVASTDPRALDWCLQEAMEIALQDRLIDALDRGPAQAPRGELAVQAVFCIDVRSEPMRRALEAQSSAVQTLGFAGFFGLPIAYRPIASEEARPQLPGLLAPRLLVRDRVRDRVRDAEAVTARRDHLAVTSAWRAFKTSALSSFTFVEGLGLTFAADLLRDAFGLRPRAEIDAEGLGREAREQRAPELEGRTSGEGLDDAARSELAAATLRAMSLTQGFARLVVLFGHGSQTRNNPHAAGLDCGACCGQTGEVNARVAASLLNDPKVRRGLEARGIHVPETTRFLAGLHDTTTDELRLYENAQLSASHAGDLATLRAWLEGASDRAREGRARRLGAGAMSPAKRLEALKERARDWAQTRPEWGLANNAALLIAPRARSRSADLEGRAFLHDYRHEEDPSFAILELLLTAPMVVAHWINLQYYASTVDNERYGSGNKVLHNVVGGHLGVFEGNGGDLRIGLPLQSLHDGERWMHTPLRLSVFVEAPREAIDKVLEKHEHVRNLVENGWLHLLQIEPNEGSIHARRAGRWFPRALCR
jgi:hypothetical protein